MTEKNYYYNKDMVLNSMKIYRGQGSLNPERDHKALNFWYKKARDAAFALGITRDELEFNQLPQRITLKSIKRNLTLSQIISDEGGNL